MMINNTCPFCGEYVSNNERAGYVKNGSGRFQTKALYHIACADKKTVAPAIDLESGEVITTAIRKTYIE